jgi:hypothetical protein
MCNFNLPVWANAPGIRIVIIAASPSRVPLSERRKMSRMRARVLYGQFTYCASFKLLRNGNFILRYLIEDYVLDLDKRELRRGADVVLIAPQVCDLLNYLIRPRSASSARMT